MGDSQGLSWPLGRRGFLVDFCFLVRLIHSDRELPALPSRSERKLISTPTPLRNQMAASTLDKVAAVLV